MMVTFTIANENGSRTRMVGLIGFPVKVDFAWCREPEVRTTLIRDRARQVNRIQKILEDANIKLASVASDVLSV